MEHTLKIEKEDWQKIARAAIRTSGLYMEASQRPTIAASISTDQCKMVAGFWSGVADFAAAMCEE